MVNNDEISKKENEEHEKIVEVKEQLNQERIKNKQIIKNYPKKSI